LYRIADVLYFLMYIFGYRKKVIVENLRNSFPEKSSKEIASVVRGFYRNLADLTMETLKIPSLKKEALQKRVKVINIGLVERYLDQGRPAVVLTGHQCNWEWLLLACSVASKYPIDAVYKPMHIQLLDRLFISMRSRFGARPLAMKEVYRSVVRNRKEARTIAMVADQTPAHSEIQYFTDFLNQSTAYFVGADKIARHSDYPVFFVEMRRTRRGYYEVEFHLLQEPPFKPEAFSIIESYARTLEACIQRHPADWLWSHRRWKHKSMKVQRHKSSADDL
jgi:KDO2-lipid IV(A) lauroyltransferase